MEELNPQIKEMVLEDLPEILRLERELFSDPWPELAFIEDIESNFSYPFVAHIDNEIIGYAILWIGVEEGHLTNIAVDKKYQRKSVAKKLLSFILRFAWENELKQIFLEVRPSNTAAVTLYESYGFKNLAIQRSYYNNPSEDCLMMKKDLTD
ncbi:MAG: ribosomal protein S18-alanine N-acetyltransferase [candidate division Zixibacteria bacterium]